MLYFHGDVHSHIIDCFKYNDKIAKMTEEDILVILGDFGVPFGYTCPAYSEFLAGDQKVLGWLNNQKFKTVVICGNHDDRDAIFHMPYISAFGGIVRQMKLEEELYENIYIVDTPQVLTLCEKHCLVIPGAESHDIQDGILDPHDDDFLEKLTAWQNDYTKMFRVKHWNWWPDEAINILIAEEVVQAYADDHFDYILTHDCPSLFLRNDTWMKATKGEEFLDSISRALDYDFFLHGHMHEDAHYRTDNKKEIRCLYRLLLSEEDLWNTL